MKIIHIFGWGKPRDGGARPPKSNQIKSNLFIVTHEHKCTDGEIEVQDSVPWQYKQQDMKNV